MYLKQLLVIKNGVILRNINFHKGLNLIIDETKEEGSTTTGNNVGKTTVLKLIYFVLEEIQKKFILQQRMQKMNIP